MIIEKPGLEKRSKESSLHVVRDFAKSSLVLAGSEVRVSIFVWSLIVSYLVASKLHPVFPIVALLSTAGYFLVFGIYVLSDVADIDDDKINSPRRPLASGRVSRGDARLLASISIVASFILATFIGEATFVLFLVFLLLGLSYSVPRVNVKKRFPLKAIVPAAGAAVISLSGGAAAQGLRPVIFFAAIAFSLFALVTLLIGDISDLKGDSTTGVRSFPVVIGAKNSVLFVMAIPFVMGALGVLLFRATQLNLAFPFLLVAISAYCLVTMRPLLGGYNNPAVCRKIKKRMRIVHFVIQLIFILGILSL